MLWAVQTNTQPILVLSDCAWVVDNCILLVGDGNFPEELDHMDLWDQLKTELARRQPHFLAIRKCKAHTTLEDLQQGIISPRDKKFNDEVDTLAKLGANQYRPEALTGATRRI